MSRRKRIAVVPPTFGIQLKEFCSKADLIELVFDLMCQSPWFDETTALADPNAVAAKVLELRDLLRKQRPK